MKQKIENIIKIIFGTKNNIFFKLALSSLITGIIFFLFMFNVSQNSIEYFFFAFASDIFLALGFIIAKGIDSFVKFIVELVRLIYFFAAFIFSLYFFCFINNYNCFRFILYIILSSIGLFSSLFFFVSIFADIFTLIKKAFKQFKGKFFEPIQSTTSNLQKIIENITAFLLAISGLSITIKTIIEPIFNIINR